MCSHCALFTLIWVHLCCEEDFTARNPGLLDGRIHSILVRLRGVNSMETAPSATVLLYSHVPIPDMGMYAPGAISLVGPTKPALALVSMLLGRLRQSPGGMPFH